MLHTTDISPKYDNWPMVKQWRYIVLRYKE